MMYRFTPSLTSAQLQCSYASGALQCTTTCAMCSITPSYTNTEVIQLPVSVAPPLRIVLLIHLWKYEKYLAQVLLFCPVFHAICTQFLIKPMAYEVGIFNGQSTFAICLQNCTTAKYLHLFYLNNLIFSRLSDYWKDLWYVSAVHLLTFNTKKPTKKCSHLTALSLRESLKIRGMKSTIAAKRKVFLIFLTSESFPNIMSSLVLNALEVDLNETTAKENRVSRNRTPHLLEPKVKRQSESQCEWWIIIYKM